MSAVDTSGLFSTSGIGTSGGQQYLRQCSLIVGDNTGNGLELGNFKVKFQVTSAAVHTYKSLDVTVYNLAPQTAKKIQNEFTLVQLSAGYQNGPFGVIFLGKIAYITMGREDAITSYVRIIASDADDAYNYATMNVPLDQSLTSPTDQLNAVLKVLANYSVTAGYIPTLSAQALPRGIAMYGTVRDILGPLAASVQCDWHIADGKLNFIPKNGYIPGDVTVLSPSSGMVGVPEITIDGLNVRSLINPNLITGRLIQVGSDDITTTNVVSNNNAPNPQGAQTVFYQSPNPTGLYKIYRITHIGDTRGTPWYSEMVCTSIDPSAQQPFSTAQYPVNGS